MLTLNVMFRKSASDSKDPLFPPHDWVEHRVPFSENGLGFWHFSNNGAMLENKEGERSLINTLFYHGECIYVFLSMIKADIDGLFLREHKGFSDRYFVAPHLLPDPSRVHSSNGGGGDDDPQPTQNRDWRGCFDPFYPHYIQYGNVDPRLHRTRKRHESECEYCVLDRLIVQLETDMEKMFTYQQQWRFSDTCMRLGEKPIPPFPLFPSQNNVPSQMMPQSPNTSGAKRARMGVPASSKHKREPVVDDSNQRLDTASENEQKQG